MARYWIEHYRNWMRERGLPPKIVDEWLVRHEKLATILEEDIAQTRWVIEFDGVFTQLTEGHRKTAL
jgi:hypothetical protein